MRPRIFDDGRFEPTLTRGEAAVASLAVRGARIHDIARGVAPLAKSVRTHLAEVYRKLGVRGSVGLAAWAAR